MLGALPALCTRPGRDCKYRISVLQSLPSRQNKLQTSRYTRQDCRCPPHSFQLLFPSTCRPANLSLRATRSITHPDVLAPALISAARPCPEMPVGNFEGDFQHLSSIPPTALLQLIRRFSSLFLPPSLSFSTADRLPGSDPLPSAPRPRSCAASGAKLLLTSSRLFLILPLVDRRQLMRKVKKAENSRDET